MTKHFFSVMRFKRRACQAHYYHIKIKGVYKFIYKRIELNRLKLTFIPKSSKSCLTITPMASRSVLPAFVYKSNSTLYCLYHKEFYFSNKIPIFSNTHEQVFRPLNALLQIIVQIIEFKLSGVKSGVASPFATLSPSLVYQ